jgi:hypothetical protein
MLTDGYSMGSSRSHWHGFSGNKFPPSGWLVYKNAVKRHVSEAPASSIRLFACEQLGVNFKALKAARLLPACGICDLRTACFTNIFTLLQFFIFKLANSLIENPESDPLSSPISLRKIENLPSGKTER